MQWLLLLESECADLSSCGLGAAGAVVLGEELKGTKLTGLDLRNNRLGAAGAAALAETIKENATLTTLDLSENRISEGLEELGEALQSNETLTKLNLASNNVGTEGCAALAVALRLNKALTQVDLTGNDLGLGMGLLAEALHSNTNLRCVGSPRGKDRIGAFALAELLKRNRLLVQRRVDWRLAAWACRKTECRKFQAVVAALGSDMWLCQALRELL